MRPANVPTLIKRYGGSRFYDTVHLQYVTHDDLAELVWNGERFVVRDAEAGEDLILTVLNALQ